MHDQHDDHLERELSRLSEYTGDQPATPLWQQAMTAHEREKHERVWVWVRRPAPALAAAGLAVLVASIALRPIEQPVTLAERLNAASNPAERSTGGDSTTTFASNLDPRAGASSRDNVPSADLAVNSPVADRINARVPVSREEIGGNSNLNELPVAAPSSSGYGVAMKDQPEVRGGGGQLQPPANADAIAAGSGNGGAPGRPPTQPAGLDTARLDRNAVPANTEILPQPAVRFSDVLANAVDIPEPTANLSLAVADVGTFYKFVPTLVNEKMGEQVIEPQQAGSTGKDAEQVLNLTIRVNEERLPVILGELKKSGRVQAEFTQQLAKETRLTQIDELISNETQIALKPQEAVKAGTKNEVDVDTLKRKAAEGTIDALNRRRAQIEKGGELATINIVAVPETAPGAVADKLAIRAFGNNDLKDRSPAPETAARGMTDAKAENVVSPSKELTIDNARSSSRGTPGAKLTGGVSATLPADSKETGPTTATVRFDGAGGAKAQPIAPGAAPGSPRPLETTALTTPPPPSPASAAPPSPTGAPALPVAPEQASSPKPEASRMVEGGKISQAARDGWSRLGDSTANFVRGAIGSMLYWLPALVVLLLSAWWWRRKAVNAAKEPPPL